MSCILWLWSTTKLGYGRLRIDGREVYAHRAAYCQRHGLDLSDIDGQVVRHKCDNPHCVNPDHLELGTQADNMDDKVARGRQTKGETNPSALLTAEQVQQIRQRYIPRCRTNGTRAMGREFGVSQSTISAIVTNTNWRN